MQTWLTGSVTPSANLSVCYWAIEGAAGNPTINSPQSWSVNSMETATAGTFASDVWIPTGFAPGEYRLFIKVCTPTNPNYGYYAVNFTVPVVYKPPPPGGGDSICNGTLL